MKILLKDASLIKENKVNFGSPTSNAIFDIEPDDTIRR